MKKRTHARKVRKARRAPAQTSIGGFNLQAHVPSRYPEFPRQLQFSSRWTQTALVDLSATTYQRRIGLFDFLNQIPEYSVQMFELYRYSRIVGVDVHLQVAGEDSDNITNTAYEAAMAKVPYDQSLSPSPQQLRVVRGSQYKLASIAGINRVNLRHHYGSFDELGNPAWAREFWQDAISASNTTPVDPSRPVIAVAVSSTVGQAAVVSINLTVTYHMQWFELQYLLPPTAVEFEMMDTKSVVSAQPEPGKELRKTGAVQVQKGRASK